MKSMKNIFLKNIVMTKNCDKNNDKKKYEKNNCDDNIFLIIKNCEEKKMFDEKMCVMKKVCDDK